MKSKLSSIIALSLSLTQLAFRPGDRVEFSRDSEAHTDRDVRQTAANRRGAIKAHSHGEILTVFPYLSGGKGGQAIQVKLTDGQWNGERVWVYFNPKQPLFNSNLGQSAQGKFSPGDRIVFLKNVNAHADANVRHDALNKIYLKGQAVLPGTQAQVISDRKFPPRINDGDVIQLKALSGDFASLQTFWVYFTPRDPWIQKMENGKIPTDQPSQAMRLPASEETQTPLPLTLPPAQPDKIEAVRELRKSGSFELLPTYEFSHLTVTDSHTGAQASIYSSSVIGADFRGNHLFSSNTGNAAYFQTSIRHYSLDQPLSVATLSGSTPTTWNFEVGESYAVSKSLTLSPSIGYGELLSLSGGTSSSLSVDLVRVPRLSLSAQLRFAQDEDFETGIKAHASVLLPGEADNYSTHFGSSETFLLYGSEENQAVDFSAGAGVELNKFNTGFSSLQETSIVIQLGLEFELTRKRAPQVEGSFP